MLTLQFLSVKNTFIRTYQKINFELYDNLASPSPPTEFTVSDITSKSVTLHWGPPESNGGSEITGTDYKNVRMDTI